MKPKNLSPIYLIESKLKTISYFYDETGLCQMKSHALFSDRHDAGRQLAERLRVKYGNRNDVTILALPRGGVPVAKEISVRLNAPMDVIIIRKISAPGNQELAIGAIAEDGVEFWNHSLISQLQITRDYMNQVMAKEKKELQRRRRLYRGGRSGYAVQGKTVILVDDGVATGAAIKVALSAIKLFQPARIVVAVPSASENAAREIAAQVDEFVAIKTVVNYESVGSWYSDFDQLSDREVMQLLAGNSSIGAHLSADRNCQ